MYGLKAQKLIEAARPEGAEALSPGQRPGFVGVSLAPCKGKSFKKHLIKNENSLRYVKLLPLQGVLLSHKTKTQGVALG